MATLSKNYIELHRNTTHSYAAFGKLVIDALLDQAEAMLGSAEADMLNVPMSFDLSPFAGTDCIRICIQKANGETWCANQFTDEVYKAD